MRFHELETKSYLYQYNQSFAPEQDFLLEFRFYC